MIPTAPFSMRFNDYMAGKCRYSSEALCDFMQTTEVKWAQPLGFEGGSIVHYL